MHWRQPRFTKSAGVPFTKNKKRINKKTPGSSIYFCQNKLDKACFHHDMTYEDFKDLNRRTAAHKVFCDVVFHIVKNPKYDGYLRGLGIMVYKIFDIRTSGSS